MLIGLTFYFLLLIASAKRQRVSVNCLTSLSSPYGCCQFVSFLPLMVSLLVLVIITNELQFELSLIKWTNDVYDVSCMTLVVNVRFSITSVFSLMRCMTSVFGMTCVCMTYIVLFCAKRCTADWPFVVSKVYLAECLYFSSSSIWPNVW